MATLQTVPGLTALVSNKVQWTETVWMKISWKKMELSFVRDNRFVNSFSVKLSSLRTQYEKKMMEHFAKNAKDTKHA